MKSFLVVAVYLLTATFSVSYGQSGFRFGIGTSLNLPVSLDVGNSEVISVPYSFYIPLQFDSTLRIEPQLGYRRISQEIQGSSKTTSTISITELGVGLSILFKNTKNYDGYAGARFSWADQTESEEFTEPGSQNSETTRNSISFGPHIGGEYIFGNHLGVGLEFQIMYSIIGNPEHTPEGLFTSKTTATAISTNALIFARYFF